MLSDSRVQGVLSDNRVVCLATAGCRMCAAKAGQGLAWFVLGQVELVSVAGRGRKRQSVIQTVKETVGQPWCVHARQTVIQIVKETDGQGWRQQGAGVLSDSRVATAGCSVCSATAG